MASSRVDEFLARVRSRRGNLVFAMDATASREGTWDKATTLTGQMFQEVSTIGTLSMQLVYFKGVRGFGGECKASKWNDDASIFALAIPKIKCESGETQIEFVLAHVIKAAAERNINALIFVGDACEEERDVLVERATRLAGLNIPCFIFQEGTDPGAQQIFKEIVKITKGAYFKFDSNCLSQLADTLNIIAKFAVGGAAALPPQERKLIGQQPDILS